MLRIVASASLLASVSAMQLTGGLRKAAEDPVTVVSQTTIEDIVDGVVDQVMGMVSDLGQSPEVATVQSESPVFAVGDLDDAVGDAVDAAVGDAVDESPVFAPQAQGYDAVGDMEPVPDADGCSDVRGKYKDTQGQEVTVFQVGCLLKVKMLWGEEGEVMKAGRVDGQKINVQDFAQDGEATALGDILFADGASWERTDKSEVATVTSAEIPVGPVVSAVDMPAEVAAATSVDRPVDIEDMEHTSNTAIVKDSLGSQADAGSVFSDMGGVLATNGTVAVKEPTCVDVDGHYSNKDGSLVSVKQTGCEVNVLMKLSDGAEETLEKGTIDGMFLKVWGLANVGAVRDTTKGDVEFLDGPKWTKLSTESAVSYKKDGCDDLSGYYSIKTGQFVKFKQVGCHAVMEVTDEDRKTVTKFGRVVGGSLSSYNFYDDDKVAQGQRDQNGGLTFGQQHWTKLGRQGEKEMDSGDNCTNITGNYRDADGTVATITQNDCHVKIQMNSGIVEKDSESGDVTIGGNIFGNLMHARGLSSVGKVNQSVDNNINFFDGKVWTALTAEASKELGIPEGGCTNFAGTYRDTEGNPVKVGQADCKLWATFYLSSINATVTREGYVAHTTVHIQDFVQHGIFASGNIQFGTNLSMWTKSTSDEEDEESTSDDPASATFANMDTSATASKEDCDNFDGLYLDATGHDVLVNQTGCELVVTLWVDAMGTNMNKTGNVVGQGFTLNDFVQSGVRTSAGVKFGDDEWYLADPGTIVFRNITMEEMNGKEMLPGDLNTTRLSLNSLPVVAKLDEAELLVARIVSGCDWNCYVKNYPNLKNEKWEQENGNMDYARTHYVKYGFEHGLNCKCEVAMPELHSLLN